MKSFTKRAIGTLLAALTLVFSLSGALAEGETAYGADAVKAGETYTLEQMLTYALQDEYLAEAEYKAVIGAFGALRPFISTLKAESNHIAELTALMKAHGIAVPENSAAQAVTAPATQEEALKAGAAAEEKNIAMYGIFLQQDGVPGDVKAVFTALQKASEKHLAAFTRNMSRAGTQQNGQTDTAAAQGRGRKGRNADSTADSASDASDAATAATSRNRANGSGAQQGSGTQRNNGVQRGNRTQRNNSFDRSAGQGDRSRQGCGGMRRPLVRR